MAFKIFILAALVAASQAGYLGYNSGLYDLEHYNAPAFEQYNAPAFEHFSAPAIQHYSAPAIRNYGYVQPVAPVIKKITQVPIVAPVTKTVVSPAPAHYDFGYSVSDPYAALHQSRVESRRGDVVKGSYALLEADGSKRIVDYIATPHEGFKAVVRKEPVW